MNEATEIQPSWDGIEEWIGALEPLRKEYFEKLIKLLDDSKKQFAVKNLTEPAHTDWSTFRPLKSEKENDWSDWLAHLLEKSKTGYFANLLLNNGEFNKDIDYSNPTVERETYFETANDKEENRRTDLFIHWKVGHTHIEVKVGDTKLEKTYDTSEVINQYINKWKENSEKEKITHYILLLDEQKKDWDAINPIPKDESDKIVSINVITWNDLAAYLRNAIITQEYTETNEWNVWACSFLGCVEQKLLGLEAYNENLPIEAIKKLTDYHQEFSKDKSMTIIRTEDTFLQKGFLNFKKANVALLHFKNILESKIKTRFNKEYWKEYHLILQENDGNLISSINTKDFIEKNQCFVYWMFKFKDKKKFSIGFTISWDVKKDNNVNFHAYIWETDNAAKKLKDIKDDKIKFSDGRYNSYFLEATENLPIEEEFEVLLKALYENNKELFIQST